MKRKTIEQFIKRLREIKDTITQAAFLGTATERQKEAAGLIADAHLLLEADLEEEDALSCGGKQ